MDAVKAAEESFIGHMDDDLNSADAITDIFNLVTETNKAIAADDASAESLKAAQAKIIELTGVLGVKLDEAKEEIPAEVMELAGKRAEAKKAKDFALADSIRDQITALGYSIKDTPKGPQLEKIK
jgi:cysteinyl-tRNA synthetase